MKLRTFVKAKAVALSIIVFSHSLFHKIYLQRIFPKKIQPSPFTYSLLTSLYPSVNWEQVKMYEGLPWFLPKWTSAIVLPASWHYERMHIYFRHYEENDVAGLSTIVHEGMHVLQANDLAKAKGLGLMRGFIVSYIGLFFKTLWDNWGKYPRKEYWKKCYYLHQMEIPAFGQGDAFYEDYHAFHKETAYKYWEKTPENLLPFLAKNPHFIKKTSKVNEIKAWGWKVIGVIACLPLAILFPFSQLIFTSFLYFPNLYFTKNQSK